MNDNGRLGVPIRAAVVGFGYWGPNLARNIAACDAMDLAGIAEVSADRRVAAARTYPSTPVLTEATGVFEDPSIDLIVVATPPASHVALIAQALRSGKHVLAAKPFVTDAGVALALADEAEAAGLHLLVDHTFLFTGAVREMRARAGDLGQMLYYDATRTNLGTFQRDTDVVWDLAPHDLSILLALVPDRLIAVSAVGACHAPGYGLTMAYLTLRFATGLLAHVHLNWMAPAKVRRTIIGGSRRMMVYDDVESSEKLKVYESAGPADAGRDEDMLRRMVDYRVGDVLSPRLDQTEALATEIAHVARVLRSDEPAISGARLGVRVVRVIDAVQRSIAADGAPLLVDI